MEKDETEKLVARRPEVEISDDRQVPDADVETDLEAYDDGQDVGDEPDFDGINDTLLDDIMSDNEEPPTEYGMDIDMLMTMGIAPADACRYARKCMRPIAAATTFHEVYGRGGLSKEAKSMGLNLKGLQAMNFCTTKADGHHWDFSKAEDRKAAWKIVHDDDPDWIVGSPPCTNFSPLNVGLNFPKMDPAEVERRVLEGLVHLKFVCQLYRHQARRGKHFLHEHPKGALSWKTKPVMKMLKRTGVETVSNHQCMFGLLTPGPNGTPMPAKKPTKWMTNSIWMIDALRGDCDGSHKHQHLLGGRAAAAAFYPQQLLRAILKGMAATRDNLNGVKMICDDERHVTEALKLAIAAVHPGPEPMKTTAHNDLIIENSKGLDVIRTSSIPLQSGGTVPIQYLAGNFKDEYKDEYTGEVLPMDLVRAAMEEELNYFNAHVWDATEKTMAATTDGYKLIRMRWVICNKGDSSAYDVRARLVACEVNTYKTDEYYAATPPLEAKKLLFSEYANTARRPTNKSKLIVLSFVDIKKAYFNGVPRRNIHLAFPRELGIPPNLVAHLKRCVYGTRDAGAIWEDCYADALVEMGFVRGVANGCNFYHSARGLRVVVHGDDFTCLGPRADVLWYEDALSHKFEIKRRGHIGEGPDCVKEIRILNRILRLTDQGLRYEADPRHAELLVQALDLTKSVITPGVKGPSDDTNYDATIIDEDAAMATYIEDTTKTEVCEMEELVAGVSDKSINMHSVSFSNEDPMILEVVPYSEVYGIHPRFIVASSTGWKRVSESADPFTGKSNRVLKKRRRSDFGRDRRDAIDQDRYDAINAIHWFGSAWQIEDLPTPVWKVQDSPATCKDPLDIVGAVRTPSVKPKYQKRKGAKAVKKLEMAGNLDELLSPDDATNYRGLSARGNFLAQDRVDISFATKELCREFAAPANSSLARLKRLGRFLLGKPRLVYLFNWVEDDSCATLEVPVDTDFAGCRVTRRSTSGGVMLRGPHCLKHWSTTQSTIALSSGEAELGGLCKGAANAIGMRAIARDLGIDLELKLLSDATAALGISRRLGVGKIRHLDTSLLWIQQRLRDKDLSAEKVLGTDNPADVLTKHVDYATLLKHMTRMGLVYENGRADSAPATAAAA